MRGWVTSMVWLAALAGPLVTQAAPGRPSADREALARQAAALLLGVVGVDGESPVALAKTKCDKCKCSACECKDSKYSVRGDDAPELFRRYKWKRKRWKSKHRYKCKKYKCNACKCKMCLDTGKSRCNKCKCKKCKWKEGRYKCKRCKCGGC